MKKNLILSLGALSSGALVVNALGLLIAQSMGAGANEYIFIVLTSLSALSGANIAANEVVAIRLASKKLRPTTRIILATGAICALSTLSGLWFLYYYSGYGLSKLIVIVISGCGGLYSMLSFAASYMYYKRLLEARAGPTTRLQSFVYGVVGNGVLQSCIVALALSAGSRELSYLLVCLAITTPPAAQIACMQLSWRPDSYTRGESENRSHSITLSKLISHAVFLSFLSQAGTVLKGMVSTESTNYQNIVFFSASLLATTTAIVYKSMFLTNEVRSESWKPIRPLVFAVMAALVASVLAFQNSADSWIWCGIILISILIPTLTEIFRRQV